MRRAILKKSLNLNYIDLFSKSWTGVLTPLLGSAYMFNLMAFLSEIYALLPNLEQGQGYVYPYKSKLFENFRACKFEDLKVVIIGKEPFGNKNATGIPFANPFISNQAVVEDDTILIERCIRRHVYNNDTGYLFDESLYTWGHNGVFLLDAASTSEENYKNAHGKIWKNFTREVIRLISTNKENVIFLLWGKEAQYFKKYIDDSKHYILEHEHPSDAKAKNNDWNCPHFVEVNKLLAKIGGDVSLIPW